MILGYVDYSKIINPECSNNSKMPIKTLNVDINLDIGQTPLLRINVGPPHISYVDFLKEGYSKFRNRPSEIQNSIIEAKDVTLTPHNEEVIIEIFFKICIFNIYFCVICYI